MAHVCAAAVDREEADQAAGLSVNLILLEDGIARLALDVIRILVSCLNDTLELSFVIALRQDA